MRRSLGREKRGWRRRQLYRLVTRASAYTDTSAYCCILTRVRIAEVPFPSWLSELGFRAFINNKPQQPQTHSSLSSSFSQSMCMHVRLWVGPRVYVYACMFVRVHGWACIVGCGTRLEYINQVRQSADCCQPYHLAQRLWMNRAVPELSSAFADTEDARARSTTTTGKQVWL